MAELLETVMVICFGISWPSSILKSYRSRTSKGKSLSFLCIIAVGYSSGIMWKMLEYRATGIFKYMSFLYVINLLMVLTDIALYFRNRRLDSQNGNYK